MAGLTVSGTAVRGIASAVPAAQQSTDDLVPLFGAAEMERIAQVVGVRTRRVGRAGLCCSDLCFAACESLLTGLGWDRGSIDALILVSHSFDYPLPATSCILQERLGLPKTCAAFDVGLGCSGYVYGLWIGASLISGGCQRVLLLAGDMTSRLVSPADRTTVPLFGDAGSATALESDAGAVMHFELGTDGSGHGHLIIPAGTHAARVPLSVLQTPQTDPRGYLFMDGAEVFAFTLREVPPMIASTLKRAQWEKDQVDFFFLHQANQFMLVHLARKMGIPPAKVPIVLGDYGNTGSPSLPLAITHAAREILATQKLKLLLAGFGVGFSWGACALEVGPIVIPPLVEVP